MDGYEFVISGYTFCDIRCTFTGNRYVHTCGGYMFIDEGCDDTFLF
jgi:hypothetical protein